MCICITNVCSVQQLHIGRAVPSVPACLRIAGRPAVLRAPYVSLCPFLKVSSSIMFVHEKPILFDFVIFLVIYFKQSFFNIANIRILFHSYLFLYLFYTHFIIGYLTKLLLQQKEEFFLNSLHVCIFNILLLIWLCCLK